MAWLCRYGRGLTIREIMSCESAWLRSFARALADIVESENASGSD